MKRLHFFSLVATLGLIGCVDTRNPVVTVRSAGGAVLENNLKDFQATLEKSIQGEWGTQEKLNQLKLKFSSHLKMEVGPAVLTHVEQSSQGWGYWGDVIRLFDVDVLDKATGEVILQTEIKCTVWVDQILNELSCPNHQSNCNSQIQYIENQDCRLTKIID